MKTNNYEKWTDAKFKKIFLIFLVMSIIPILILISLTRPMEDKYKALMDSKQVYIMDLEGNNYYISASQTKDKTNEILGRILIKKMFTFSYDGSKENLNYVKQYASKEAYNKLILETEILRSEVVEVSGSYDVEIEKYYMSKSNNEYILDVFFDHKLKSKAVSSSKKYMVRLLLASASQTTENHSGIFLRDYKIFADDDLKEVKKTIEEELE